MVHHILHLLVAAEPVVQLAVQAAALAAEEVCIVVDVEDSHLACRSQLAASEVL